MPKDTMTPRERWLAVLTRKRPDRIPMDYWGTPEASRNLMRHLGCASMEEVYDRLHIDAPAGVGPRYIGPPPPEGEDIWGVRHRNIEYDTGVYSEPVNHPLAGFDTVEQIEAAYRWPSPDWWEYSDIPRQVAEAGERPIRGGGSEPFLQYCVLRGLERGMMDLVENPEIVEYCLGRLFDLCYESTTRIYEQASGKVGITYVAEDMGSQEGMLFSPVQVKRFLLPGMKRMIDLAHQAGALVFHHSDGAVRPIIPTMIEAGIDVLNPVQWRCKGMNREGLKRDFGDRLVFHGGVDNQYTLALGTVEEVRKEVEDNIRILGDGGGYIMAPCHNIQAVSPPENIVAMYETGYALGRDGSTQA
ncbi:MAG: uroporphyrinogen-III decarboxylase-like protein [Armatimonadetes bacterium]|nr:uroporphyrinogen-III decarboxylase-like protein [Armatimonadota bacterium]